MKTYMTLLVVMFLVLISRPASVRAEGPNRFAQQKVVEKKVIGKREKTYTLTVKNKPVRELVRSLASQLKLKGDGQGASARCVGSSAAELVKQLGDDSFQVREKASKALVRLGSTAKVAVQHGLKSTDLEVRRRCKSILLKISDLERRRALDALGVRGVKRVTTYLSNIENEEETRNNLNNLNDLKGAYFKSFIEDVSTFSDEEIYFIIPELIKLLKNDNLLPGGPKGSSYYQRRIFDRADHALSLVAGVSLVTPFGHPNIPWKDIQKVTSAKMEKAWRKWWKAQKGKTRKQWLENRRQTYNSQLKNALSFSRNNDVKHCDYYMAQNAIYLMVALKDKPGAMDLLVLLKVEFAKLKLTAVQLHSARNELMRRMIKAIGELGNLKMVPDLVKLAKTCNTLEIAAGTNILRAFATTLNKLSGKKPDIWQVTKFEYLSKEYEAYIIKESAFAMWLLKENK